MKRTVVFLSLVILVTMSTGCTKEEYEALKQQAVANGSITEEQSKMLPPAEEVVEAVNKIQEASSVPTNTHPFNEISAGAGRKEFNEFPLNITYEELAALSGINLLPETPPKATVSGQEISSNEVAPESISSNDMNTNTPLQHELRMIKEETLQDAVPVGQ